MLAFLLGFFRMVWLFEKDHRGVVLENLALQQQLSIYLRKHKHPSGSLVLDHASGTLERLAASLEFIRTP